MQEGNLMHENLIEISAHYNYCIHCSDVVESVAEAGLVHAGRTRQSVMGLLYTIVYQTV